MTQRGIAEPSSMHPVLRSGLSARLEVLECRPEGASRRPPVLFVHGAFTAAWTWAAYFLPYFAARGVPSYAVSLRGHGGSYGRDALPWHSLADYADDLAEVIEALGSPPVLVGHSMGAVVVMKYLQRAEAPAAVLLAPVPPQGLLPASFTLALATPDLFVALNAFHAGGRPPLDDLRRGLFAGPITTDRLVDYQSRLQPESQRALWDLTLFDLPQSWRMPRTPMLILLAERDALLPLQQLQIGFAAIGLRTEVLEGLGHAVMLEPDWVRAADRILHWLEVRSDIAEW